MIRKKGEERLARRFNGRAKEAWDKFLKDGENVHGKLKDLAKDAFSSMGNSLVEYITTGKANFSDFLMTFLKGR
jgi:lambda family phage tail tape measure protein